LSTLRAGFHQHLVSAGSLQGCSQDGNEYHLFGVHSLDYEGNYTIVSPKKRG
jgi:hypothetical protein